MVQKQQESSVNPNLQARFEAGPTRNVLLLGADYSRSTDRGRMDTNFGGYFTAGRICAGPAVQRRHDRGRGA